MPHLPNPNDKPSELALYDQYKSSVRELVRDIRGHKRERPDCEFGISCLGRVAGEALEYLEKEAPELGMIFLQVALSELAMAPEDWIEKEESDVPL